MSSTTIPAEAVRYAVVQMEQPWPGTFAAGPRRPNPPAPIMSFMQKTTHIRRYVLLRHRDHGVPASRWSMERIAAAPRSGASAPAIAPVVGSPDARP